MRGGHVLIGAGLFVVGGIGFNYLVGPFEPYGAPIEVMQFVHDTAWDATVAKGEFADVSPEDATCDALSDKRWTCVVGSNGTRLSMVVMRRDVDDFVAYDVTTIGTYDDDLKELDAGD